MTMYWMYLFGAFAAAAISFTISFTAIFKWLRELVSPIHHKIEELIHCPWCLGFWTLVILHLSWNVPSIVVFDKKLLDFLFTVFMMYPVLGLIHYVLLRAYEPVAKSMTYRNLEKQKRASSQ